MGCRFLAPKSCVKESLGFDAAFHQRKDFKRCYIYFKVTWTRGIGSPAACKTNMFRLTFLGEVWGERKAVKLPSRGFGLGLWWLQDASEGLVVFGSDIGNTLLQTVTASN